MARGNELKQFYRGKDFPAQFKAGSNQSILSLEDTKYFLDLFWAIEPQSIPEIIKQQEKQEIETSEIISSRKTLDASNSLVLNKSISNSPTNIVKNVPTFWFDPLKAKGIFEVHPNLKKLIEDRIWRIF